jgi:hypothetical protein
MYVSTRKCLAVTVLLALAGCGGMEEDAAGGVREPSANLSAPALATNTKSNCPSTAPALYGAEVVGPTALTASGNAPFGFQPDFGRLQRGSVQYVSANYVHVKLVTDTCTVIHEVRMGSRILTATAVDGYRYDAADSYPQPADASQHGHSVFVFFPYDNKGTTDSVSVVVRRIGGTATAVHSFPLVRVDAIHPRNSVASVGLSDTQLENSLARTLYDKFGGAANQTWITQDDGTKRRIYGLDKGSIYLYVNGYGVHFGFSFKIDINNFCDPTARVHGTFKLAKDITGLTVVWTLPPQTSLSWPTLCSAPALLPIGGLIPALINDVIDGKASGSIRSSVEKDIQGAIPSTSSYALFLQGARTETDQVLVDLQLPFPQLELEVPYDAFDMGRPAMAFPANETFVVLAHGIGMRDGEVHSGPDGLPNGYPTPPPIGTALSRSITALPFATANVAQLVARTRSVFGTTTYRYAWGCGVSTSGSPAVQGVSLGVNDTAPDAQHLRGVHGAQGYKLRLGFVSSGLLGSVGACPSVFVPPQATL